MLLNTQVEHWRDVCGVGLDDDDDRVVLDIMRRTFAGLVAAGHDYETTRQQSVGNGQIIQHANAAERAAFDAALESALAAVSG